MTEDTYAEQLDRALKYTASHEDLHTLLSSLTTDEKLASPGTDWEAKRGAIADALQEHGRDEEAERMRSNQPVGVHEGKVGPGRWTQLDAFGQQYLDSAIWTTGDEELVRGDPNGRPGLHDFHPDTVAEAHTDTQKFQQENAEALGDDPENYGGHHFWLTRSGHGSGFGNHEDYYGYPHAHDLHAAAQKHGEYYVYRGDDGMIHGSHG